METVKAVMKLQFAGDTPIADIHRAIMQFERENRHIIASCSTVFERDEL